MPEPRDRPRGYVCACTEGHQFSVYVRMNWEKRVEHLCHKCGRVNAIKRGEIVETTEFKKEVKA
jgi:hypothetical protein